MERVLTFKYPYEKKEEKDKLKEVFVQHSIEFICYESNGYYAHEFVVRKSGRKWNNIYKIINSVKAAKYNFKNVDIRLIDGKPVESVKIN